MIIAACETFIAEVLKPRFLAEIRLHAGVSLAEALRILETDGVLHPV